MTRKPVIPSDVIYNVSPPPRLRDASARRSILDIYTNNFNERAIDLASQLHNGALTPAQWELAMRQEIKDLHTGAVMISRGGEWRTVTQADWGRLGGHIRKQYEYLHRYAQQVQQKALEAQQPGGKFYSEKYLQWRSKLYGGNARASFYRGMALNLLPQIPGDGQTECKCVTTPESRVLTRRGYVPIKDVVTGDFVLTHRNRWRLVTDVSVHPSFPSHRQAWASAPGWKRVGFTSDHRLWTRTGWIALSDIDGRTLPVGVLDNGISNMRMWSDNQESGGKMSCLPFDLSLWQHEGLSGGRMHILRHESQDEAAMGGLEPTIHTVERAPRGRAEASPTLRGLDREVLPSEDGWSYAGTLLGSSQQEAIYLSLPMEMGTCIRANTKRLCNPPQEWGLDRRQARESRVNEAASTCDLARAGSAGAWHETDMGLSTMRARISLLPQEWRGSKVLFDEMLSRVNAWPAQDLPNLQQIIPAYQWRTIEILLEGMLPPGSPLYDIEVEEDHSFIIEGIVVHNSNCKCYLDFEEGDEPGLILVTWHLTPAEHCESCINLAATWNPYELWLPLGISAREWITYLPGLEVHIVA